MIPPNTFGVNGHWLGGLPWAVYTPRPAGSGTSTTLTYGSGNVAVLPIIINWGDLDGAIGWILGTNEFNRTSGNIDRKIPVQHPDPSRNWMYASAIQSIKELQAEGKVVTATSAYATYKFAIITILFTQPRWIMLTDSYLDSQYGSWTAFGGRQEWRRFVTYEADPVPEVISRKGGNYTYTGSGVTIPTGPFPLSKNVPINSREIKLTWRRVPLNGLRSNQGAGLETNQNSACLTVNSNNNDPAFFPGALPGQLLMEGWKAIEMESPVDPAVYGTNLILSPGLLVDVQFSIRYKQPPNAVGYVPNNNAYGHLQFPGPGGDINWYSAQDSATGSEVLPRYDFRKVFQCNL